MAMILVELALNAAVITDNWIKANGTVLHGDDYFPALPPARNDAAQMFSSRPRAAARACL